MIRRTLGRTGIEVSLLGLGTVKFGRNEGLKLAPFDLPTDAELRTLLDTARDLGINLLDTAAAYGRAEQKLGELLTDRERWVVCSKAGETFESGRSYYDFSRPALRRSAERSSRLLGYVDIMLLHSNGAAPRDALETLLELREEGKVRAIGVSHKNRHEGLTLLADCDVIMATLNDRYTDELPLIRQAYAENRGVLIKKPLASGSAAPVSLAATARHPEIGSIIVGTTDPAHLAANAAILESAPR